MKRSERDAQLLNAIRCRIGTEKFTAGSVVHRVAGLGSKAYPDLAAKLGKVSAKSLGYLLKRNQGELIEGWRLCAEYDKHLYVWRYQFIDATTLAPGEADIRDAEEFEQRMANIEPMSQFHELGRQLKKIEQKKVEQKEQREFEAGEAARAELMAAVETRGAVLTTTRTDPDGRLVTETLRDRDGQPLSDRAPKAPDPVVAEVSKRPRNPQEIRAAENRPPTREEWNAWQQWRTGRARSGIAVDGPTWHEIYQAGNGSGDVSLLNGVRPRQVTTTSWGQAPDL